MKNKFLLFALLFVSIHRLFAVPAVPWAIEKVQPDGTEISVYLRGDEWINWMECTEGYTLLYDSLGYVVYAQTDERGNLVPSTIRFGIDEKPETIVQGLFYSEAQINALRQFGRSDRRRGRSR